MATTIPKRLYVTIQYRKDATEGLLGFASPYTKDAAFAKRKATQDQWAYGYSAKFTIDDDEDISAEFNYNENFRGTKFDSLMLLAAGCYPKILDNSLHEGFEIAKSVRRSGGWGGSGNVVWRISDPRGFELEITSENLAKILDCTTIIDGVIQGKCTWGREGSRNILLPESSAPYKEATALTELVEANVTIKDIAPGDEIELLNSNIASGSYIYMGTFKVYTLEQKVNPNSTDRYDKYVPGLVSLMSKGTSRPIFKSTKTGKYSTTSTPKIGKILARTTTPLEPKATAIDIMQSCEGSITNVNGVVTLLLDSKETFSKDKLSYKLVDTELKSNGDEFPRVGEYSSVCELYFTEKDNAMYMTAHESYYDHSSTSRNGYRYRPLLIEVVSDTLLKGELQKVGKMVSSGSSYWSRRSTFEVRKIVPEAGMQFKRLVLEYNGTDYPIVQIGYMY